MFPWPRQRVKQALRRLFSRVRYEVEGLEHVPRTGPAIIIMNHTGWEEILFAILAVPRPLKMMGMHELMFLDDDRSWARIFDTAYARNLGLAWRCLTRAAGKLLGAHLRHQLREVGYIPTRVFAEHWPPRLGSNGLREAVQALEAGEVVLIFPEGGYKRDGVMRPFKRGLGLVLRLLDRRGLQAPIIPAAQRTAGCISLTLGNRYIPRLIIGPPLVFSPDENHSRIFDETVAHTLQDQVNALLHRVWPEHPPQTYALTAPE
jgi:1-acyl-sn-glycerol-3-phosphate acyltransferase